MSRTVKVTIRAEYEDTFEVDEEEEHLTDEELHDKYASEADELLEEAVSSGWHDTTSVDVEVLKAED